jgi:hypothetical protein
VRDVRGLGPVVAVSARKVTVKDTDKGWKDLHRRLFSDGGKAAIEVGVFGAPGEAEHKGTPGLTVLQVGTFQEFGLGVPERSFIRAYFDENAEALQKMSARLMASLIDGKRTRDQCLELLGLRMVAEIQKRIAAGISPPNAQSTIDRKKSSTPLVDTGQLRSSISYRVVKVP